MHISHPLPILPPGGKAQPRPDYISPLGENERGYELEKKINQITGLKVKNI
jgi:hypothetical protein